MPAPILSFAVLLSIIGLGQAEGPPRASAGGAAPKPAFCLPYPRGVLPTFEQTMRDRPNEGRLVISADGSRIAMNDPHGRVVAWKVEPGASPTLFATGGVVQALTAYGALYVRGMGALSRVELVSGQVTNVLSGVRLPLKVTAARIDDAARLLVVSRTSKTESELSIIDDCVLAETSRREAKSAAPARAAGTCPDAGLGARARRLGDGWFAVASIRRRALTNGLRTGKEILAIEEEDADLAMENPDTTNVGEVVVFGLDDGAEHRRWRSKLGYLQASEHLVAEWSDRSHEVVIADPLTGKEVRRIPVEVKAHEEIRSVIAVGGRIAVQTAVGALRGAPATWHVYDADSLRPVSVFAGAVGGFALARDGSAVTADDKGVCWYGRAP